MVQFFRRLVGVRLLRTAFIFVLSAGLSMVSVEIDAKPAAKSKAKVQTKPQSKQTTKPVSKSVTKSVTKKTSAKTASNTKSLKGKTVKLGKVAKVAKVAKSAKAKKAARLAATIPAEPPRVSLGQAIGLHAVNDPADLRSSVALAVDSRTGKTLFEKNSQAVLPIASITKLMTAMVVLDAKQSMGDPLEISSSDVDLEKNSRSRLRTGSVLNRGELLQLALMASENRAANALSRYYPGGTEAFVTAMNRKAKAIQMEDTQFFDATGLSSRNMSNARDLVQLVKRAGDYPVIRQYSTASELTVDTGFRMISFKNTNRLIENPEWQISLSKTGYISEAGNCLVMHTRVNEQPVVMVFLDAVGRYTRFADASRLRIYLESGDKLVKVQTRQKVSKDGLKPSKA
jgi:serine-type D-Ala-D-Ala endopeptidase (penicillin-binding protein 7)